MASEGPHAPDCGCFDCWTDAPVQMPVSMTVKARVVDADVHLIARAAVAFEPGSRERVRMEYIVASLRARATPEPTPESLRGMADALKPLTGPESPVPHTAADTIDNLRFMASVLAEQGRSSDRGKSRTAQQTEGSDG